MKKMFLTFFEQIFAWEFLSDFKRIISREFTKALFRGKAHRAIEGILFYLPNENPRFSLFMQQKNFNIENDLKES